MPRRRREARNGTTLRSCSGNSSRSTRHGVFCQRNRGRGRVASLKTRTVLRVGLRRRCAAKRTHHPGWTDRTGCQRRRRRSPRRCVTATVCPRRRQSGRASTAHRIKVAPHAPVLHDHRLHRRAVVERRQASAAPAIGSRRLLCLALAEVEAALATAAGVSVAGLAPLGAPGRGSISRSRDGRSQSASSSSWAARR